MAKLLGQLNLKPSNEDVRLKLRVFWACLNAQALGISSVSEALNEAFAYQGQWNPGGVNPGAGQARRIDDVVRRVELVVGWNEEQKLQ